MVLSIGCFAVTSVAFGINLRFKSDPTQFLGVSELTPPGYMPGSTTSSSLNQASYGQEILSILARSQLDRFKTQFDGFGETLGETQFGRAKFKRAPSFANISCCYPDFPASFVLSKSSSNVSVNLTTTPTYYVKK